MIRNFSRVFAVASISLATALLPSCGGTGTVAGRSAGAFEVTSSTLSEGDAWALNRPIDLVFNHPVDESSISFSTIILKPLSPEILAQPVTGSFSLLAGFEDKVVRFTPACPTNSTSSNGGFIPGGYAYTLTLPTGASGQGLSVLRDDQGRSLSIGLKRDFTTPLIGEPFFIDSVLGPVQLLPRQPGDWPTGLNLLSDPDASFIVRMNQPVDSSVENLNTERLYLLYSEPDGTTFKPTSKLPGQWLVIDNCNLAGATLRFEVRGIMPPGRKLRLQMSSNFLDLSGESNTTTLTYFDKFGLPDDHQLPTLNEYYGDTQDWSSAVTYDQFTEDFETPLAIDLDASLNLPMAVLNRGYAQASFDFPGGSTVDPANDFLVGTGIVLVVNTTGTNTVTDSNGRPFTVVNGVLSIDDLLIEAGGTLKGEGLNPLVIYATGKADIQGTLDASGDNALRPQTLNHPELPEPGALGHCGGGNGGTASYLTTEATLRGESGFGPFQSVAGGGNGGEGGFQQNHDGSGSNSPLNGDGTGETEFLIAGGGGGGGFTTGTNQAVLWDKWSGDQNLFIYIDGNLTQFDDNGPDSRYGTGERHSALDPFTQPEYQGAESGLRGSSWKSSNTNQHESPNSARASAAYGMEDVARDVDFNDFGLKFDPAWTSGTDPAFGFGHPTNGPDPGLAGPSMFGQGTDADDFWGRRINPDGTATVGQLTAPLAGSGGGASGDMQILYRILLGFDGFGLPFWAPLTDSWPDPEFPYGLTRAYYKGAPGGGGGGQLMLFTVGPIVIGNEAVLKVNGGSGSGGEAVFRGDEQVSGSGGGSGGHLILHSSTNLDLSDIDLGLAAGATINQIKNPANFHEVMQALGGRRGWSMAGMPSNGLLINSDPRSDDGNSDYMAGRGGAGANGLIQIHVPNPVTDIVWHPNLSPAIDAEIAISGVNTYVDNDKLEAVLRSFCVPAPKVLVAFYATGSQIQSKWIDTGLGLKRNPVGNPSGEFLTYTDSTFAFGGIETNNANPNLNGRVLQTGDTVDPLPPVATAASGLLVSSFTAVISNASVAFGSNDHFLTNPNLLLGFDLQPAALSLPELSFEIVAATYDSSADQVTLTTLATDGDMAALLSGAPSLTWYVRPKFMRFETGGVKDSLPSTGFARIEFQGVAESALGSNLPGSSPTAWTTDLADLEGMRFFRYRLTLEMAETSVYSLDDPRPLLRYLSLPIGW
jgi:hypothetical protein